MQEDTQLAHLVPAIEQYQCHETKHRTPRSRHLDETDGSLFDAKGGFSDARR